MKIDTHLHTTCSDGRNTVAELFQTASRIRIELMSVTDHDTLAAYPEAFDEAGRYKIALVPGMELSTRDEGRNKDVHVVGLKVDTDYAPLRHELKKLADARLEARKKLLDRVNAYLAEKHEDWQPLRFEDVRRRVSGNIVGKPHIAAAIIENAARAGLPVDEQELYRLFRQPGIESKKAYELTMEECIGLIDRAGGVAVLAHPCEYADPAEAMERFVRLGGRATELCKYRYKMKIPSISALEPVYRPAVEHCMNEHIMTLARRHGLKLTASSDYHGKAGEPGMETGEYGIDVSWLLD
ncbi:MAG: DNA polymerase III PolC [Methanocella sp. PtaU1.Bin125]|nr:MAG: DNA polymerase III PolC [Methanocella sp. PtaU1.Bin125]